ncbi:MAG: hypothetical protein ACPGO3_15970 [Magnetospiraceae bacterium]
MTQNARQTGPALEAMYQFILWLVPTVRLAGDQRYQRLLPSQPPRQIRPLTIDSRSIRLSGGAYHTLQQAIAAIVTGGIITPKI